MVPQSSLPRFASLPLTRSSRSHIPPSQLSSAGAFQELGLNEREGHTLSTIRSAYLAVVMTAHPDLAGCCADRFKRIQAAYEELAAAAQDADGRADGGKGTRGSGTVHSMSLGQALKEAVKRGEYDTAWTAFQGLVPG